MATPFKTQKEHNIFLFIVFLLFLGFQYYGYNTEMKKQASANQKICGKVTRIFQISTSGWDGRTHRYFTINGNDKVDYTFTKGGNLFKEYYSPFWESNKQFFSKMSIGDNVCVTFSQIYHEDPKKKTLYLLKIQ